MAATIIITAAVGVLVFFAVRKLIKDRKQGGCGGCTGCGAKDGCPHSRD